MWSPVSSLRLHPIPFRSTATTNTCSLPLQHHSLSSPPTRTHTHPHQDHPLPVEVEREDTPHTCHSMLCKRALAPGDPGQVSCRTDGRKSVEETARGRRKHGILAAVTPCLQVAVVRPLCSAEFLTQVLIFVPASVHLLPALEYMNNDNALGIVRHLRARAQRGNFPLHTITVSNSLANKTCVIDRLHLAVTPWLLGFRRASIGDRGQKRN